MSDERTFIHDISNSITISCGLVRRLERQLKEGNTPQEEIATTLFKIQQTHDKIVESIKQRRHFLMGQVTETKNAKSA